jgi:ureidoglycolate lyase
MRVDLRLQPLTRTGFAPFGDVVEMAATQPYPINQGFAERFNNLAAIDVGLEGGQCNISMMVAKARTYPLDLAVMERHPLGSQLFYPLLNQPWMVVVCHDPLDAASYCAFQATGAQGVNYARNSWHHPLLVYQDQSRFMVVDRLGPGNNLEEVWLGGQALRLITT